MLTTKEKGILKSIIRHCERVEKTINNITEDDFYKDENAKDVVCFNIFQIGELAKKLPNELLFKYKDVPWKDIKGMRDWVGHGYMTISFEIVWKSSSSDITKLKEYCKFILQDNE